MSYVQQNKKFNVKNILTTEQGSEEYLHIYSEKKNPLCDDKPYINMLTLGLFIGSIGFAATAIGITLVMREYHGTGALFLGTGGPLSIFGTSLLITENFDCLNDSDSHHFLPSR